MDKRETGLKPLNNFRYEVPMVPDSPKPILSLGITPALQRTLEFDRFEVGAVNRARTVTNSAAGKAVNVGMALATLGRAAWVTGFNGGATGRQVEDDARGRGARPAFTGMRGATRVCDTIIDRAAGQVTELVEEAPAVSEEEWKAFEAGNLERMGVCAALIISGTVPPSLTGRRVFQPFAERAAAMGMPWMIDSHRGDLLAVLGLRPTVVKMNRHELEMTFGERAPDDQLLLGLASRLAAGGAQHVFITDGARPSWLLAGDGRAWRIAPPPLPRVVNPIGSGDCATAALMEGWLRTGSILLAARQGVACGSANAATLIPAQFERRDYEALLAATPEPR
jgi:1-phosphofructokinase family hexose kinase